MISYNVFHYDNFYPEDRDHENFTHELQIILIHDNLNDFINYTNLYFKNYTDYTFIIYKCISYHSNNILDYILQNKKQFYLYKDFLTDAIDHRNLYAFEILYPYFKDCRIYPLIFMHLDIVDLKHFKKFYKIMEILLDDMSTDILNNRKYPFMNKNSITSENIKEQKKKINRIYNFILMRNRKKIMTELIQKTTCIKIQESLFKDCNILQYVF